jgi:hypothetical protein
MNIADILTFNQAAKSSITPGRSASNQKLLAPVLNEQSEQDECSSPDKVHREKCLYGFNDKYIFIVSYNTSIRNMARGHKVA